jgi:hypothetical protein
MLSAVVRILHLTQIYEPEPDAALAESRTKKVLFHVDFCDFMSFFS